MNQIATITTGTEIAIDKKLVEGARRYFDAADTANTTRAYVAAWRHFTAWCAEQGQAALPTTAQTLALYITACADQAKVATIQLRLAAISRQHRDAGLVAPTTDPVMRQVWRGIRRTQGTAVAKKAPVLTKDIQAMMEAAGTGLRGLRDRALILTGFAGAFRRSELVALNIEDIAFPSDGAVATVRRSKTDQEGTGTKIALPYGSNPSTCPVRVLQAWIAAAGITTGPVFRAIHRTGTIATEALSDRAVALIVQKLTGAAGLDASQYAGHSLRAGLVTQAAINGVAEHRIMRQSRHKSVAVLRGYIRDADMFTRNAAGMVGL